MSSGQQVNKPSLDLVVYIDYGVDLRLRELEKLAGDDEFSVLGLVKFHRHENGTIWAAVVDEIHLVEQKNTSGTTEMDEKDTLRLMQKLSESGREGDLKCWIHSHGCMSTFFSGTDELTIEKLAPMDGPLISICVNKDHQMSARVDLFVPIRARWDIGNQIKVLYPTPDKALEEEFKEKCSKKSVSPVAWNGGDYEGCFEWANGRGYGHHHKDTPPWTPSLPVDSASPATPTVKAAGTFPAVEWKDEMVLDLLLKDNEISQTCHDEQILRLIHGQPMDLGDDVLAMGRMLLRHEMREEG